MRALELAFSTSESVCVVRCEHKLIRQKDHGVHEAATNSIFKTAEDFFSQPLDVKSEIYYKKSAILRGYEPIAEVRTDETKMADLNEAFNCGYEPQLDPRRGSSEHVSCWSL